MSATTTSDAARQCVYYHTSLYRFSRTAAERIIEKFSNSLEDVGSATCAYADEHHRFEITCLLSELEKVEKHLDQTLTSFCDDDAKKANDTDGYQRQALKFPEAASPDQSSEDESDSDTAEGGAGSLGDLIDLGSSKEFWTPNDPATNIESFCSAQLLEELGRLTGCQLSLDAQNRQVLIKSGPDFVPTAAKRKLSNLEALSAVSPGVCHSLRAQNAPNASFQFLKLWDIKKNEHIKSCHEDGTLTRLLIAEDSSFAHDRDWRRRSDRIHILRVCHFNNMTGNHEPQMRNLSSMCKPTSSVARKAFSEVKFRNFGETPSRPKSPSKPAPAPIRPEKANQVTNWIETVDTPDALRPMPGLKQNPPASASSVKERHGAPPPPVGSVQKHSKPQATPAIEKPPTMASVVARSKSQLPPRDLSSLKKAPPRQSANDGTFAPVEGYQTQSKHSKRARPQPPKPPQPKPVPKSVASNNRFGGLIDLDDGGDWEVKDELAGDDGKETVRLRVNSQQAGVPRKWQQAWRQRPQNLLDGPPNDKATDSSENDAPSSGSSNVETSTNPTSLLTTTADGASDSLEQRQPKPHRPKIVQVALGDMIPKARWALERARAVRGTLTMTVQIGQVIVMDVPRDGRKVAERKQFQELMGSIPKFDSFDKTFTPLVSTSAADMDVILDMLGMSGQTPVRSASFLELGCRRSYDSSYVRLVVDVLKSESGVVAAPFAKTNDTLHGAFYAHHPQHVWDSRFVIASHVKYPLAACSGAEAFMSKLSMRDRNDGPVIRGRDDDGLEVAQCRLYTTTRWAVPATLSPDAGLYVELTKVVCMPVLRQGAVQKGPFMCRCSSDKELIANRQLWYEVTLGFRQTPSPLRENEPFVGIVDPACPSEDHVAVDDVARYGHELELGEKASWTPEDVLTEKQLGAITDVAARLVERMDSVGLGNRGPGAEREEQLVKQKARMEAEEDQFW